MKIIKKISILIIMFLVIIPFSKVNAAGGFTVSSGTTSLTKGKTTILTIKTTNAEGKFTVTSSNSNVVSVSKSSFWVTSTETVTLTAKNAGSATITINPENVADTELNKITGAKTITINVKDNTQTTSTPPTSTKPVATKSNDATLKSITIGNNTYTGSALNGTISYTADSSVNSIGISAVKNNSKATISGTGTKSLVAGKTNTFTIKVTAEDGTVRNYKINITRLAVENTEPNIIEDNKENQEKPPEGLKLTSLIIKDIELNTEFNPDVLNYIVNTNDMTELEIDATANKESAQINIEGASKLQEGNNKIVITVSLEEESIQYIIDVYNKIEAQTQAEIEDKKEQENKIEKDNTVEQIKQIIILNWKIISIIVLICVLSIISILCAISAYKNSQKVKELTNDEYIDNKSQEQEKNENNEEETIEKNKKIGKHF